jgi:hypothetical protein
MYRILRHVEVLAGSDLQLNCHCVWKIVAFGMRGRLEYPPNRGLTCINLINVLTSTFSHNWAEAELSDCQSMETK